LAKILEGRIIRKSYCDDVELEIYEKNLLEIEKNQQNNY